MAYKVTYNTVAIMNNGTYGNISQGKGVIYTDADISEIETAINEYLQPSKRVAIIEKIETVQGSLLTVKK